MRRFGFALILLSLLTVGCSHSPTGPEFVMDSGTVHYLNLEGGFYGIFGDDGGHYDPTNLPDEMKVEGLRVKFTAWTLVNSYSYHQWGKQISVRSVNRLN